METNKENFLLYLKQRVMMSVVCGRASGGWSEKKNPSSFCLKLKKNK